MSFNKSNSLSKSLFTRGLQCHKSLWLYKFKPDLRAKPDASLQARFDTGNEVGILAQELIPGGHALAYKNGFTRNINKTNELIAAGVETIYEATFRHDDILVMVDILHKGPDGWEMYEVKSSTETKDIFINDTAIQYYVAKGAGLDIAGVFLVHINNQYTRIGELDLQTLFAIDDVTNYTVNRQTDIAGQIADMRSTLQGSEPGIDIGPYCTQPYECDFKAYCWQHIPEYSIFDINNLRANRKFALYYGGALHFSDIPADFTLSEKMQIQVEAELTGRKFIKKEHIREFLGIIAEPVGFMDFETFQEAIPSFDNQRPYQMIPLQYSLHINDKGNVIHHEFLGTPGLDPRRKFIEQLLADTESCASILVYNQSFEESRLKDLALIFHEYADGIAALIEKMVDLMTPFRKKDYYVKEMCGSHSIKYVLPALVPELSYNDLAIGDGEMAMLAYAQLNRMDNMFEIADTRKNLLEYCRLDTLAMVKIWEKLRKI
jgi:hypothetical protein